MVNTMFDIQEGDQYTFCKIDTVPKTITHRPCQVWFVDRSKNVAVFRMITSVGHVSVNRAQQYVLTFDEIKKYGKKLTLNNRKYPTLPKDIEKLFIFLDAEGFDVSYTRHSEIMDYLDQHKDAIHDQIDMYTQMLSRVDEYYIKYNQSRDQLPPSSPEDEQQDNDNNDQDDDDE